MRAARGPGRPLYYSAATLNRLPRLRAGERIQCPECGSEHEAKAAGVTFGPRGEGEPVLVYKCGGERWLAGIGGRNVVGTPPDEHGPAAVGAWKREDADA